MGKSSTSTGNEGSDEQQLPEDNSANMQSSQFAQMMAQQQRARMEQIQMRQMRQGGMAGVYGNQGYGGMPNLSGFGGLLKNLAMQQMLGQGGQQLSEKLLQPDWRIIGNSFGQGNG